MQDICDGGIVLFTCIQLKAIVNTIEIARIKNFECEKDNSLQEKLFVSAGL